MSLITCSTEDLVRLCKRNGYRVVVGGKGLHIKMARDKSPMIIIPGGRDNVSPGVALNTLRNLGIERLTLLPIVLKDI